MKNVTGKFKIWLVVTMVLLVAGMTVLGIFGLNKTADIKPSYEVEVKIEVNTADAGNIIKSASETYFKEKGLKVINYATLTFNDGEKYAFKFNSLENLSTVKAELETAVETALANNSLGSLDVTVEAYESFGYTYTSVGYLILGLSLSAVAVFVYYFFMEKLSGALTVLCTSVLSALVYLSLASITRLPAEPYFGACVAFAGVFAGILSGGIVNRGRELIKNVGNDKKSYFELGDMATASSITRFAFITASILIALVLFAILGSMAVKFMAIQVLFACISALFTSFAWTALFWAWFKNFKKDRKIKQAEQE